VAHLYEPLHPAILRLTAQTVKACHDLGKWVGMCGEMAADPDFAPILVGLELDELSVSASLVPKIKKSIRDLDAVECKKAVQEILKNPTRDTIDRVLRRIRR
jgi:phosphoenolpyruvate-protein phosphotransferase (PTS system enzyme I)